MKFADYYWEHPQLTPYIRKVKENSYLFHQGESGTTMFVIAKGLVELIGERNGQKHLLGIIEAGQFLGEKAVLSDSPHQRAFSAKTKTETTILELGLHAIEKIRKNAPDLMNDLLKQMFQMAALRLDRANQLTQALRTCDHIQRFVNLIEYFIKTTGRPSPNGVDFLLTPVSVNYYIDLPIADIRGYLGILLNANILKNETPEIFTIRDADRFAEKAISVLKPKSKKAA